MALILPGCCQGEPMRITTITSLILASTLTLTLLSLTGCDRIQQGVLRMMLEPAAPDSAEDIQVISNIVYSQTPQGDLLLDLYLPAESAAEPLPVVLFFFGGAFEMGNKHQLALYDVETLPLDGFAVVSIDYRLSAQAIFPAQLEDAQNALQWIQAHAGQYNLDAGRVGVWGMSAGGMLASLVGVGAKTQGDMQSATATPLRVQAVVDYYGPSDFLQGDAHELEGADINWASADSWPSRYLGGAIGEYPDRVAASNPITYVSADDPPFLLVHGDKDSIVPFHQSELLYAALQQAGVDAELHVVKGGDHARGGEFGTPELHRRTVEFLQQHLQ
jgi:acetyl esterase/lipase